MCILLFAKEMGKNFDIWMADVFGNFEIGVAAPVLMKIKQLHFLYLGFDGINFKQV